MKQRHRNTQGQHTCTTGYLTASKLIGTYLVFESAHLLYMMHPSYTGLYKVLNLAKKTLTLSHDPYLLFDKNNT